jgi:uncharacterized protein YdhG (YjbR/CyaY superfamily)
MPKLAFSPRKSAITIYFSEGFDRYSLELQKLGKHKQSVSCLYINKLSDIDLNVLRSMLRTSFALTKEPLQKPTSVDDYCAQIPTAAKVQFEKLRTIVKNTIPNAEEVLSYGILGYSVDGKRPKVYISGWKDHIALYPVPKQEAVFAQLAPYIKGRGTVWFPLDAPLPEVLIKKTIQSLIV